MHRCASHARRYNIKNIRNKNLNSVGTYPYADLMKYEILKKNKNKSEFIVELIY